MENAINLIQRMNVHLSVCGTFIDPRDNMCSKGRESFYYEVGRDALWNIVQSMIGVGLRDPNRILDFPSGFGRVTRYLRAAFPAAKIDIGDIWEEAVTACGTAYSASRIQVKDDLRSIDAPKYDVIFCGSLLTHFSEEKGIELLEFFREHLAPNGIMVVSCCGRKNLAHEMTHFNDKAFESLAKLNELRDSYFQGRYVFANYPGQVGYGRSFTPISWFHNFVVNKPDLIITRFAERGWDDNQDVVTIKKI